MTSSKYEDLATTILERFTDGVYQYGVCPCSWVNDNLPERGQVLDIDENGIPIAWYSSYAYVEHPTQYSEYFKVY